METVIKLTEINKIYRTDEVETQALENVNIEVRKGEFLSIMGPSGCGKSTLLNIMGLLDEPTSGEIELCGQRIDPQTSDNRLAELRNKTLGFVFQSFHLIPTLNVIDNVQLPLIYRGVRSGERIRLAKEVIERVGLSHRMKHRSTQLSGGQCQRVAIARAIIGNPEILLADEPTSGEIELCGTRIDPKLSDNRLAELRNKTLGFVFQSFHLIPTLNVLDNVQLPLIYRGVRSGERIRLAKEVIERVGLSHRMKHRPTQLSGGQCQRVAIARAIIGNPEILLADEPTGNLDSKMGAEIMELLHRLNREDGRTIVMVTHNEQQAQQTDRIIKFLDGRQIF